MAAIAGILDFRLERFQLFWSTSHCDTSYQMFSQFGLLVQEKFKIDFQGGGYGGHVGFPI